MKKGNADTKSDKEAQELNENSESEVEKLKKQCLELDNNYKRALADYQNLEKRVREEKLQWILSANRDLLLRLLPAIDMIMLAQKHTEDQGVTMTAKHVLQTLKEEGIEQIPTIGQKFNPETMEVVTTEEGDDGMVLEELAGGYLLRGKVLRPARVKVGKKVDS